MTINKMLKSSGFLFIVVIWHFMVSAGNYPFPQNFTYPYGIKATNGSTATLTSLYASWKSSYVTSNGCPNTSTMFRIQRNTDGYDTVSEGMGYGMLLTVYFDD